MTPTQQRGYDDQRAGMLNPALADADTPDGKEYRDGVRQGRRDAKDGIERTEVMPSPVQVMDEPPPPVQPAPSTCAAFTDRIPEEKPKRKKKKQPASGQLELL